MDSQNRRNFLVNTGKTAPLQPVGNVAMGSVTDQKRAGMWVDPYAFWYSNQFWEEPGRMFSKEAKQYYREWLAKLKKQSRNFRPTTK